MKAYDRDGNLVELLRCGSCGEFMVREHICVDVHQRMIDGLVEIIQVLQKKEDG